MLRTSLRNLAAHKLRLLTTGLAVVLGVAFMAGTLIFTDTLRKTYDDLFADAFARTDAVVRAEAAFEDPNGFGSLRGRIDDSLLGVVGAVDGVAVAQPHVEAVAQIVDTEGEPVGTLGAGPPTLAGNWYESDLNAWTLFEGRAPAADDEVVLDKASAEEAGYRVGDRAVVLLKGVPVEVTLTGTARFGEVDRPGGLRWIFLTTPAAQRLIGEEGKLDLIAVDAASGVSEGEVVRRVAAAVPGGLEVMTGAAFTEESQDALRQGLSFFYTFLFVFAVIALLVGGFMIFNTFFITVAQRTRENALMRAIGASRRQVLVSVLAEALAIGVLASLLGLGAGLAVAVGLQGLLGAIGFDLPTTGLVFTGGAALTSFLAGVIVTVVAAVSPARKAAKVPPVAAMRDVAVGSTGYGSKERIIVGLALLGLGVGGLLYGLFGDAGNPLAVVGAAALVVFFGVSVLGRTVALPLSRFIGKPLPRLRGITGSLARENAMRNPKRTAATASALMIGVGLVAFITIFAASTKASFSRTVDRAFQGDFIVTTGGQMGMGGVAPEFADRLNALPEVEQAGGIRLDFAEIDGSPTTVIGADRATFDIFDVEPLVGSPDDLDATSIAVWEGVADDKGLRVGDTVPVTFRHTGATELRVGLIYRENAAAGNWLLPAAAYNANFPDNLLMQVFVKKSAGASSEAALAAVEGVAGDYPNANVVDQTGYKAEQMQFVDQMLGLVYALLGLAILIALLGIGNTLALSILERTRELGVLRAVGMTRSQLRSAIRWESVIIALQGTALGLGVGLFFAWALVSALGDEGLGTFSVPVGSLASFVILAVLAGVLAAVLPARRAARIDVLRAVVSE